MHQTFRLTLGMVFILTLSTGEALAQYYGGYGGWGGKTPEGNFARGAGFYELGAGGYNRDTAIANSIEQDTILRWNEYMFQSQQEANRRAALRRAGQNRRTIDSGSAISKRVRENPDEHDLRNGDALNAILDEITNPKVHGVALRTIKNPISGQVIREIPFESASEAVTLSLHQLTGEGKWPVALHGERFAAEPRRTRRPSPRQSRRTRMGTSRRRLYSPSISQRPASVPSLWPPSRLAVPSTPRRPTI